MASSFIVLVIAYFLTNIGLNNILDNVTDVTTCTCTLKNVMTNEGVDNIYLEKNGYEK